jgi:hypothetical protein
MTCNQQNRRRRRPNQPNPFPSLPCSCCLAVLISFLRLFPEQKKEMLLWFSLRPTLFDLDKPGQRFSRLRSLLVLVVSPEFSGGVAVKTTLYPNPKKESFNQHQHSLSKSHHNFFWKTRSG